jgi:malonyl-CoA O-methyltransferase
VLKASGFFAFSTFGPDTLYELRSAWAQADGYNHVNHFSDMHEVGDVLLHAGLMEPVLDVDRIEVGYPDVITLMRDLKAIGAHNVTAGRPRALAGRARLGRVQQAYENFRRDERLPATYEVIYGASWGAAGRAAAPAMEGVAHIAPGSIRRVRRP